MKGYAQDESTRKKVNNVDILQAASLSGRVDNGEISLAEEKHGSAV